MSDLRSEIVNKVLNQWDTPTQDQSITRKIFDFIQDNPSCTVNDVVDNTGIGLGRASATTLSLYQRGKLDRKLYPNPDPSGKRTNVYVYWTAVDSFSDITARRVPKIKTKPKKEKVSQAKAIENDILAPLNERLRPMPRMPQAFNPETFVQDLSLKQAKAVYEVLKGYFSG